MVAKQQWPEVESPQNRQAYPLDHVHPLAQPRFWDTPVGVHQVTKDQAREPRRCCGEKEELARLGKSTVYWCRSCDRRVPNGRTPFCRRHKKQRHDYALEFRREEARPVTVSRDDVAELHRAADALAARHRALSNASDEERGLESRRLVAAVAAFTHQVRQILPPAEPIVARRPLTDPWSDGQ